MPAIAIPSLAFLGTDAGPVGLSRVTNMRGLTKTAVIANNDRAAKALLTSAV